MKINEYTNFKIKVASKVFDPYCYPDQYHTSGYRNFIFYQMIYLSKDNSQILFAYLKV